MTWTLIDAQERNKINSNFEVPSDKDLNKIKVGDVVKLIFTTDNENELNERMWVIVESINGGVYTGSLNNEPTSISELKIDDKVDFDKKHVIQISE